LTPPRNHLLFTLPIFPPVTMPEFRQLSFELPEFFAKPPPPEARRGFELAPGGRARLAPAPLAHTENLGGGKSLDQALTQDCRILLGAIGGLEGLIGKIRVCWNVRLATTAGLAYHRDSRIELNPLLRDFQPEEPCRTLLHELAHLVAHHRAGRRRIQPHGPEWQQACAELGIAGEDRCHSLPFQRTQRRKRFAYRCRQCRTVVPRVRPLARDSACFPCCREHNGGQFHSRFLLERIPLDEARRLNPTVSWA